MIVSRLLKLFWALLALSITAPVLAQDIKPLDVYQDPNGIDVTTNNVSTSKMPSISIPAAPELTFQDIKDFMPVIEVQASTQPAQNNINIYTVSAGSIASDAFRTCGSELCYSEKGTGSKLKLAGDEGSPGLGLGGYQYTQGATGKFMRFDIETEYAGGNIILPVKKFLAVAVSNPGGRDIYIEYDSINLSGLVRHRPSVVTSRAGYELRFTYHSNSANTSWGMLQRAEIVAVANPTVALASLDYGVGGVTDIAGRVYNCICQPDIFQDQPASKGSRMRLPGEANDAFDTTRPQNSQVRTVENDGVTYTYTSVPDTHWPHVQSYGPDGTWKRTMDKVTITGPDGFFQEVDITNVLGPAGKDGEPRRRIDSITDSQGRQTQYEYTAAQRLKKIIYPEGNAVEVTYSQHGNLVERRSIAKPSASAPDIVETASYSGTGACTLIQFDCYNPEWVRDAKGNQTDFTWDASHGGMLTQLDPVNAQNRRRKVINTWSDTNPINGEVCGNANNSGSIINGTAGACLPRLLKEEVCETDANGNELTCGTAASFVRELTYFDATGLPLTETVTDGVGNAPLTTAYTYDAAGRQVSADGPLPGDDDATYARYDVLGRKIWEIGPKGENGLRPASKTTYRDADDQIEKVETGMVAGNTTDQSPTALAFTDVISVAETEYNARRLAVKSSVADNANSLFAVTQMSYDARNREDCTAIRMNAAVWMNLPTSACTQSTAGSEGPDRITKKHYDTESRVIRIEQGVGTSLVRDYATYTFTPNGQMASMTDARGYKASMLYDGFDRQTHWYFPDPDPGQQGAINQSDYEKYTYDANGNRTTLRKRDGSVLSFTYDNLNRVIQKTVPSRTGLSATHTRDVHYRYDIRGLQTLARFDSLSGEGLETFYDRYGWVTRNRVVMDGVQRDLVHYYNVDGTRRLLNHPDGKVTRYNYSSGGQFNEVRDHGNAVIADYTYNSRGQLSQINRDSTAPDQYWSYDPIGRLASTGWSNGGVNSVTWGFTRNPANQIKTETQSNDAFSWDAHVDVTRTYATNGLNQYTNVSGNTYCYDDNGNLTRDGQYAYLYDVENRLVEMRAMVSGACPTGSSGYTGQLKAQLRYDPAGRLYEVENFINGVAQGPTRFLYDGDALVAEYNASGTMLARYIHGPAAGADDPIAAYTGSGVAATDRTNLYADARGSIVLNTRHDGTNAQINTYDAYGVPGSANTGRFQYTGQVWLAELGMNYYKARMYSPQLGRFMQTDPIGYEDNVNLYGYVGNDPVNGIDPTGLNKEKPRREAQTGTRIRRERIRKRSDELRSGDLATSREQINAIRLSGGDSDLQRQLEIAASSAIATVEEYGNEAEISFGIFERADGSYFTVFEGGVDGKSPPVYEHPDGELRISGHVHNRPYTNSPPSDTHVFFGLSDRAVHPGPSEDDATARASRPNTPHVLFEVSGAGRWRSQIF